VTAPRDSLLETLRERLGAQYAIEGLLGQGGMGSVYRGRDLTLDRPVAIKVIGGDVASSPQLRERFLREARTVAKLRHPNIVAVYSAGDAGGLLYFAMELVPGESLRDLLAREGRVEAKRAERILHELALALDYAHSNGIVHRDVKPENILLDRDTGRAMLTDFGVAHALEGDGRMTGTGMILGSPRYMSPEQASGETALDGRSDLYSLALVGYETFTGKPVVESGNVAGMLVKHLTETPRPLADAVTTVPEGVAVAIDRALAKDRAQRWANGREMAEVIGMAWTPAGVTPGTGTRAGVGAGAGPPGRVIAGTTGWVRGLGPRGRAIAAGVGVLALAAGLWGALAGGDGVPRGVDPRRSYAVMPFEVQSGNRDVAWLRDGAVNMLTLAMNQWQDLDVADYEQTMVLVREAGLEDRRVDLDHAREIARRARAWTVVTGTITTTTDSLRIDARLYDVASGRSLDTDTTAAIALADDPRPLFDALARYLLGVAGGSATSTVGIAEATTSSLVAYRAFLEGVRALNSWRLREADSLFLVAVRADSTFALAWHKRAQALGYTDINSGSYMESSRRAVALADRLPERERLLVVGHDAVSRGMIAATSGEGTGANEFREAQVIYSRALATDSSIAEAWYGLADALFHQPAEKDTITVVAGRLSRSLQAFRRTLEFDSTFHLAYSHLVTIHQNFSAPQAGLVVDGDSVRYVGDAASLQRAGGPAAVAAMRVRASATGLEMARLWARADPDASAPYMTLAQGQLSAGHADSAVVTMQQALARPSLQGPAVALYLGTFQLIADDPRAAETFRGVVAGTDAAALRRASVNERFNGLGWALAGAAATGNETQLAATERLFLRTDSVFPGTSSPTATTIRYFGAGLRAAMRGSLTAEERRQLLAGIREVETGSTAQLAQRRNGAATVAYLAYLLTKDTVFSNTVRRFQPQQAYPELDAREAMERGDTATARRIAATFTRADSVAKSRLGQAGMRTVVRAEVIEDLGDAAEAAAQYEALHPSRFNVGFADPGFTVYVRSYAARARLYEQLGERDKAIAAWEEFARRWEGGDAITKPARDEASAALRRLRESAPVRRP
jgi:TolB-like protein